MWGVSLDFELSARPTNTHLLHHRSEAATKLRELSKGLFQDGGEGKETKGVPSRSRVENDHRVVHRLDEPAKHIVSLGTFGSPKKIRVSIPLHDFGKAHRLVHTRNAESQILHDRVHKTVFVCQNVQGWYNCFFKCPPTGSSLCSIISWIEPVGSISIAERLSNPLTLVGTFVNFCPNASLLSPI